jgi:hypothetical protein
MSVSECDLYGIFRVDLAFSSVDSISPQLNDHTPSTALQ